MFVRAKVCLLCSRRIENGGGKESHSGEMGLFYPIKEYLDFVFIVRRCFSKLLGEVPVEGRF